MREEKPPKKPVTGRRRSLVITIDLIVYWLSKRWVSVFSVLVGIYVGLPILAPILMQVGLTGPAGAIYRVYSPFCHQMASRSFFLFGEQYAYPRAIAGSDLEPIESYMAGILEFENVSTDPAEWTTFLLPARRFLGNEQLGFKMALCERDIAIYGFVFIGSVLYGLLRKRYRIKPMPLWLFFLVGIGPIALDGFSQLFSQYATAVEPLSFVSNILVLRESTPFMRFFTGALFGFSLVWLTYPHIDKGMQDTERQLAEKLTKAGVLTES
jgi:uncharacterized membrane protein